MTYDQYWYGDPLMVRAFYKADQIRQERMDEQAWLFGVYTLGALKTAIGNALPRKGEPPLEYPKEPISTTINREKQEKLEEKRKEQEAVWALAWMTSFVSAGKNFGKNKEQKG